jgi:hypothetical protein
VPVVAAVPVESLRGEAEEQTAGLIEAEVTITAAASAPTTRPRPFRRDLGMT